MCLNSRRELRPFKKGELNVLQRTAADGHTYLRRRAPQNDSLKRDAACAPLIVTKDKGEPLVGVLHLVGTTWCGSTPLLQLSHALAKGPQTPQEVGAHRPLGDAERSGDLLRAEPLLKAEGDGGAVVLRQGGNRGGQAGC